MGNGKWKMENGKWKMENGKWKRRRRGDWAAESGSDFGSGFCYVGGRVGMRDG